MNHSAGEIVNVNGFTTNHIENGWSVVMRWARKRAGGRLPLHSDRSMWRIVEVCVAGVPVAKDRVTWAQFGLWQHEVCPTGCILADSASLLSNVGPVNSVDYVVAGFVCIRIPVRPRIAIVCRVEKALGLHSQICPLVHRCSHT